MKWRLLSYYKVKRETCAIWITGCNDNSGSSDLKCVVYCFVGLSLSFVFGSFVVIWEPFLRVGGWRRGGLWERERELCNYKLFKNLKVLFSLL